MSAVGTFNAFSWSTSVCSFGLLESSTSTNPIAGACVASTTTFL
jgi:hypothetical protein